MRQDVRASAASRACCTSLVSEFSRLTEEIAKARQRSVAVCTTSVSAVGMDLGTFQALLERALLAWSRSSGRTLQVDTPARLAAWLWPQVVEARRRWGGARRDQPDSDAERELAVRCAAFCTELGDPALDAKAVKQIAQGCVLQEFAVCRDSYLSSAGRKSVEVCSGRVSGAHCVDCPHTVDQPDLAVHRAWLSGTWGACAPAEDAAWGVLLPPAWTELRRAVHAWRASGG